MKVKFHFTQMVKSYILYNDSWAKCMTVISFTINCSLQVDVLSPKVIQNPQTKAYTKGVKSVKNLKYKWRLVCILLQTVS